MRATTMALLLLLVTISPAMADWSDGFESYSPGSGLIGQGGWEGWLGDTSDDATVTDLYAHSGTNSVEVEDVSDVLQVFEGIDSAIWEIVAWSYTPSGYSGASRFIVLSFYEGYGISHCYLVIDSSTGTIYDQTSSDATSIVYDEWVEIHIVVDLNMGTYTSYYDGTELRSGPWGYDGIVAIELYAYGATPVYWDDISLFYSPVGVEDASLSRIKALY